MEIARTGRLAGGTRKSAGRNDSACFFRYTPSTLVPFCISCTLRDTDRIQINTLVTRGTTVRIEVSKPIHNNIPARKKQACASRKNGQRERYRMPYTRTL